MGCLVFIVALLRQRLLPLISLRDHFPRLERALRPQIEYIIDTQKGLCGVGIETIVFGNVARLTSV